LAEFELVRGHVASSFVFGCSGAAAAVAAWRNARRA
jgi:hypothetical protein